MQGATAPLPPPVEGKGAENRRFSALNVRKLFIYKMFRDGINIFVIRVYKVLLNIKKELINVINTISCFYFIEAYYVIKVIYSKLL